MAMSMGDVIKLALSLIGKRDQLTTIVSDALALVQKVEAALPDLKNILSTVTGAGGSGSGSPYSVKWLQESMNTLINAGLKVDGVYGQSTQDAVKIFQGKHGLTQDGWAGVQTTAAILDALK